MIARTLSTLVSVRCKCSDDLNVEGGKIYLTCECDCVPCASGLMSLHNWKLPPGLSGQCTAALNWLGALQPTPVFRWIHVFGLEGPQFDVPWFIFLSKLFSFVSPGFHLHWFIFLCPQGFTLSTGSRVRECTHQGWQGAVPLCQGSSTCPSFFTRWNKYQNEKSKAGGHSSLPRFYLPLP